MGENRAEAVMIPSPGALVGQNLRRVSALLITIYGRGAARNDTLYYYS
jgi:hypothetical protein